MVGFNYYVQSEKTLTFTKNTAFEGVKDALVKIMQKFAKESAKEEISLIKTHSPIPAQLKAKINGFEDKEEGFVIEEANGVVTVYGDSAKALQAGLMTFMQELSDNAENNIGILWTYPNCQMRGIKLLMPAKENMHHFYDLIDMMAYFRQNTLLLEIGGAMEYKNHPEVNEGWVKFAAEMSEYSGKSYEVQQCTFNWRKNSIHSNNGGGKFLTQAEIKEMIAYCEERGIEIIPEQPSTSHCDYLLVNHPELAERPEDPYPDTFCPSNPDSYKLLFDLFDEIIEVFNPRMINIGHDEFYSINVCDRCRKRNLMAYDILAEDINKIHDYLASKNVKTMMWCDKFMNLNTEGNHGYGGALNLCYWQWDSTAHLMNIVPETWQARDKVAKDILCLNWSWSFGEKYDSELDGFPVAYGNFKGTDMEEGFFRRKKDNVIGGICSNWGDTSPVYLQRNTVYFGMVYNDVLYWAKNYDDLDVDQFSHYVEKCFALLYKYRNSLLSNNTVEVVHTIDKAMRYVQFDDGVYAEGEEYEAKYLVGKFEITYTDGTTAEHKVIHGENIENSQNAWYGEVVTVAGTDDAPNARKAKISAELIISGYSTVPVYIDGKVYYKHKFNNPCPEKEIKSVEFKKREDVAETYILHSVKW